jgi:LytS/YehU family sensor histidine kinase
MNVWGFVLTIPSYSIYFGLHFLRHWQQSQLEVERYQKETMASQLVNLKNHLDPHFLFNNLNILSSLIDKDRSLSQEFLVRFAEVYRALLLNKGEDLVTLEEELEFIQSYIFLLEVRFERNIQFNINIHPDSYNFMIPPLTIQMLVENAIKHNIITEKRPLIISITTNSQRLHVANTRFEKREELKSKSGTGLKNIKARFKYFCDEELSVSKTDDEFRVSVPLLEIETI